MGMRPGASLGDLGLEAQTLPLGLEHLPRGCSYVKTGSPVDLPGSDSSSWEAESLQGLELA